VESQTRQKLVRLAACGFFSGFFVAAAGCSSTREIPLYAQGQVVVSLRSFKDAGLGHALRYDHPATVSSEQVGRILASVVVEEHSYFKWREEGTLLTAEDVAQLAWRLADALRKAASDQWVYFSARTVPRALTLGAIRFSDGIAFVQGGRLNLVFDNVGYVENVDTRPSQLDPRDAKTSEQVRLTAKGPDVSGGPPAVVPGDRWLGHERSNWLVFDLARSTAPASRPDVVAVPPAVPPAAPPPPAVAAPVAPAAPAGTSTPAPGPQDPEERLRKLKDLRDKGLITPEEYEMKRQEILKGL
jgi:hypothetical protein